MSFCSYALLPPFLPLSFSLFEESARERIELLSKCACTKMNESNIPFYHSSVHDHMMIDVLQKLTCSKLSRFIAQSRVRAFHRHHRGHGFKSFGTTWIFQVSITDKLNCPSRWEDHFYLLSITRTSKLYTFFIQWNFVFLKVGSNVLAKWW